MRRREFIIGGIALVGSSKIVEARSIKLLGGVSKSVPIGSVNLNFASGLYYVQGSGFVSLSSLLGNTNSTGGYGADSTGTLHFIGANLPRVYSGTGLLGEPPRTNIAFQSQNFSSATWAKLTGGSGSVPVVTPNFALAPDGTMTASRVQFALNGGVTSASISRIVQSITTTAQSYTITFYARSTDGVSTYSMGGTTPPITTQALTIGPTWSRVVMQGTAAAGAHNFSALLIQGAQTPVQSDSADVLIFGYEIKPTLLLTSYVPTTTAAVTFDGDNLLASGALATLLGSSAGTLAAQTNTSQAATAGTIIDANGSILLGKTSGDNLTDNIVAGLTTANAAGWAGAAKSVIAWGPSTRGLSLNNGTPATDTNSMTPSAPFHLGSISGSSSFLAGYIGSMVGWNSNIGVAAANSQFNSAFSPTALVAWGDSLTAGNQDGSGVTYPNSLSALYSPARTVTNDGVSGNTSDQILTRFQAAPSTWNLGTVIWSGRNSFGTPSNVESDVATMVGDLTTSQFVVISVTNGENEPSGSAGYTNITGINASFASSYGANYLDVRSMLVASYNPANGADVLDQANDIPPFSLRAVDVSGTIIGALSSSSTTFVTSNANVVTGYILTVGTEYILITGTSGTTVTSCTRGYGGTTAASYSGAQSFVGTDPVHFSAAGYRLIAQWVYNKIQQLGGW